MISCTGWETELPYRLPVLRYVFRKSQNHMRKASPKLDTSNLNANEEAEVRCQTALELKDRGEYDAARDAMFPLWKGIGSRPNTKGLREDLVPRVLLCAGILTGWLGGPSGIKEADDYARDLITESIRLFEAVNDSRKVAEAKAELAQCYWRSGDNDTARILLTTALERLTTGGNAQANALFILSSVELAESRYKEVLRILTENASLFEGITNHTIKGGYHNQLGIIFRVLGSASKRRTNLLQRAIQEYNAADKEFRLAKNLIFRAHVQNNIAYVLRELGRFKEAHQCLEQARRLFERARDKVRVAQVDDSRAQLLIAQRKYAQAEVLASNAARTFKKAGRHCLLAESLINQGIALARLCQPVRAQFIFQEAIEIAHQAGSLNRAGLAAITMIEELDILSDEVQSVACEQAREWLASSDSPDVESRLKAARKKIVAQAAQKKTAAQRQQHETKPVDVREVLFNKRYQLDATILKYEHDLISETLVKVDGKVTHAAQLLGVNRQSLASLIETKHPDLLKKRTPIRRRPRRKKASRSK